MLFRSSFGLAGCFASLRLLPAGTCRLTPLPFKVFAMDGIDNEKERGERREGKSATTTMVVVINEEMEEQEEWNGKETLISTLFAHNTVKHDASGMSP